MLIFLLQWSWCCNFYCQSLSFYSCINCHCKPTLQLYGYWIWLTRSIFRGACSWAWASTHFTSKLMDFVPWCIFSLALLGVHTRINHRNTLTCVQRCLQRCSLLIPTCKVNQKSFNKKLKKCRDDSCKSKGTRWDDSCKVKEQDGMTLAKVRHAQVSHALHWSAKYPTSAACHN